MVCPQRARALPLAARARAVLRRRLGHARRVPRPVGVLTALGRCDELRDVVLRVLAAQNARGDWPQAFEFLPPAHSAGQHDSHGDVVFWPLLAVGDYLQTTGDASLLDEQVPLVGDDGPTSRWPWPSTCAGPCSASPSCAWRGPRCRHTATATGTTRSSRPTRGWPRRWCVDLDDGAARAVPAFARGRAPCLRRGADARRGGRGRGGSGAERPHRGAARRRGAVRVRGVRRG